MIWVFPLHFNSIKNVESSVIFLRNSVLILNLKESKEAGAICFEIRIPRKKEQGIITESTIKIYGRYLIMEENKNIFLVCLLFQISSPRNGAFVL